MLLLLPHRQVSVCTVTKLESLCQKDYHTGKYLSVLLRHWQVNVSTYLIGKYLSELLPRRQVFVSTVTTLTIHVYTVAMLASISQNCYFRGKCLSIVSSHWQVYVKISNVISLASICLNCDHTSNYLSILLPYWQVYMLVVLPH